MGPPLAFAEEQAPSADGLALSAAGRHLSAALQQPQLRSPTAPAPEQALFTDGPLPIAAGRASPSALQQPQLRPPYALGSKLAAPDQPTWGMDSAGQTAATDAEGNSPEGESVIAQAARPTAGQASDPAAGQAAEPAPARQRQRVLQQPRLQDLDLHLLGTIPDISSQPHSYPVCMDCSSDEDDHPTGSFAEPAAMQRKSRLAPGHSDFTRWGQEMGDVQHAQRRSKAARSGDTQPRQKARKRSFPGSSDQGSLAQPSQDNLWNAHGTWAADPICKSGQEGSWQPAGRKRQKPLDKTMPDPLFAGKMSSAPAQLRLQREALGCFSVMFRPQQCRAQTLPRAPILILSTHSRQV